MGRQQSGVPEKLCSGIGNEVKFACTQHPGEFCSFCYKANLFFGDSCCREGSGDWLW